MAIEDLNDKQALKNFILEVLAGQPKGPLAQMMKGGVGIYSFGWGQCTWPGATQLSNGFTVTHGLGVIPVGVAFGDNFDAGQIEYGTNGTPGATTFSVKGFDATGVRAAGAHGQFFWVAFA